ncbi:hypothetical protein ABW19_dt0201917 [Dactylella cylindrospora]|nr:hypothetical protein ABW19_dt0201917 [Dactylella cylindrospora]
MDEGQKRSTFLIAQTKLVKSTRHSTTNSTRGSASDAGSITPKNPTPAWQGVSVTSPVDRSGQDSGEQSVSSGGPNPTKDGEAGEDEEDNLFDELKTTRSSSWQFELRQMQRTNKRLSEECATLLQMKKRRKRKKGADALEKDCANCHTKNTPEWRRGPSGKRDLCNSCGLRYAKLVGRISPRNTQGSNSNVGEAQPVDPANPDGPSPRTEGPTSRNNSGAEPTSTTEENTSSSENPTPGDQNQGAVISPGATGR